MRGCSVREDKGQALFDRVGVWSNRTFGSEAERGPIGPLKHLVKEALVELLGYDEKAVNNLLLLPHDRHGVEDLDEYADLQILVNDAVRRAGYSWAELMTAADAKQAKNETRTYPKPAPGDDTISEHDRSRDNG